MSKISNTNFTSIEQMSSQILQNRNHENQKLPAGTGRASFQELLFKKQELQAGSELKFSKHANERLLMRNIDLSAEQIERLESGARKAGEKGIKESLVMVDNLAFIVNVKNNTVITAVNDKDDKVFTNIDGAVIS